MILKNVDFNQPIKFLINGISYDFSNRLIGQQKTFNKGFINYQGVISKTSNEFLIFPKFAMVEHYYGSQLFFFGFIKEQRGTAHPNHIKNVDITVLDGKDWLTQSELIGTVFIEKSYDEVIDIVIQKLRLSFIKKGITQFPIGGQIEAWDSDEVDAYSVLRFIEKQSGTLLQILLEPDKKYSINFFSKADFINKNLTNQGENLYIENKNNFETFHKKYGLLDIKWKLINNKNFNIIKVSSERIIAKIAINEIIDCYVANATYNLLNRIGDVNIGACLLLDDERNRIRNLKIVKQEDANRGRSFDISYLPELEIININPDLLKKNNYLQFSYYPIRRGTVQVENKNDQLSIQSYTGILGKKSRYEKHNDAGITAHLIKYARHYLELGLEDKLELSVVLEKAAWNIGEHLEVKHFYQKLNGIYYIKSCSIETLNGPNGVIISQYNYLLTKSLDFEDDHNFYDDQSYRQKPVFHEQQQRQSFFNLSADVIIKTKPAIILIQPENQNKQNELQLPLQSSFSIDPKITTDFYLQKTLPIPLFSEFENNSSGVPY